MLVCILLLLNNNVLASSSTAENKGFKTENLTYVRDKKWPSKNYTMTRSTIFRGNQDELL